LQTTVFDTPVINTLFRTVSLLLLKILGWKKSGMVPDVKKFVMIAAPHTSNWDFLYTIIIAFAFRQKIFWMGKEKIFKKPFAPIVRWMGGIPVNREKTSNLVDETIRQFNENDRLVVVVPPEGTRKKVSYWKTGFYWIAYGAGVPILLGYLDYKRKVGGFGPMFQPTGDIDADMVVIRDFYSHITGKKPSMFEENAGIAEYKQEKVVS
jgi:1-acyl-sn-glycerol-3-phosphate acyltransferase